MNGSTVSVLTSAGVIERLTPRTAWQYLLPKPSLPCLSAGVARSVTGAPPRSILNSSVRPALAPTMRCMSEKLLTLRPSIASTTSPGWKPAAAAAESGCTASTRAVDDCLP